MVLGLGSIFAYPESQSILRMKWGNHTSFSVLFLLLSWKPSSSPTLPSSPWATCIPTPKDSWLLLLQEAMPFFLWPLDATHFLIMFLCLWDQSLGIAEKVFNFPLSWGAPFDIFLCQDPALMRSTCTTSEDPSSPLM